jgi:hypothetical protein
MITKLPTFEVVFELSVAKVETAGAIIGIPLPNLHLV